MNYSMFKTIIWPTLNELLYNKGIYPCLSKTTSNTCFIGIVDLADNFQVEGSSYTYGDLGQVSELPNLYETLKTLDKKV